MLSKSFSVVSLTAFVLFGFPLMGNASEVDSKPLVSSAAVSDPVAVRYGWNANPACNLYNKEDLPAVPFRTDSTANMLPGLTQCPDLSNQLESFYNQ